MVFLLEGQLWGWRTLLLKSGATFEQFKGQLIVQLMRFIKCFEIVAHIYAEKKAALFIPDHNGDSVHRCRRGGLKPNSESQKMVIF